MNDVEKLIDGRIKAINLGAEFTTESSNMLNAVNNHPESAGGILPFIPLIREETLSGTEKVVMGTQHQDIFLVQILASQKEPNGLSQRTLSTHLVRYESKEKDDVFGRLATQLEEMSDSGRELIGYYLLNVMKIPLT